jgi:PKD repeat protein
MGGEFTTVNGTAQQGLVRFAVGANAPNRRGPSLFNGTYPIKVRSFVPGTVTISWNGNRDQDDSSLRYRLFRRTGTSGNGAVVHQRTVNAPWWNLPVMTYTDATATGTGYQYRVQVDDGHNNFANSPWTALVPAPAGGDYLSAVLASEPDSLWRLGEAVGATAATDTVGWRDATIPASVTPGVAGAIVGDTDTAVRFSGAVDSKVVSTTQDLTLPHVFSLEAWVRTASSDGGLIIGYNNTTTDDGHATRHDRVLYMDTSGRLRFGVDPTTPVAIGPDTDYRDNEWHHIVGTLGPAGMRMYIDGALVDSRTDITNARTGYVGNIRLGAGTLDGFPDTNSTTGRRFEGLIDEPAFYRRALPLSEVANHYRASGRTLGAVNESPIARFTATRTGTSVAFNGSASSDPDGTIASWAWDFGDGGSSTAATSTTHTYSPGTYTARLVVTDNKGLASPVFTEQVTIPTPPPNVAPTAQFTATPTGLTVAFNGSNSSDSDGAIASWAWDFGDGSKSTDSGSTSHTYKEGTYTASLVVTDDDGAPSTAFTREVTVSAPPAVVAADTFGRTVAGGWGSTNPGGAWTTSSTAANYAVSNGTGNITLPNGGATRTAYLNSVSSLNSDITAQLARDKPATGGGTYVSVAARRVTSPAAAEYRLKLQFRADSSVAALLTRFSGGAETNIGILNNVPGLTPGAADVVRIRFQVQGTGTTTLRAKVWGAGASEPGAWSVTATDSTAALPVPGSVGFLAYLSGSATNSPVTVSFDNLSVATIP